MKFPKVDPQLQPLGARYVVSVAWFPVTPRLNRGAQGVSHHVTICTRLVPMRVDCR